MAKPQVFVTRQMAQEALDIIGQNTEMKLWEEEMAPPHDFLLEEAGRVDGLVTLLEDRIDDNLLGAAPNLKVVSQMAVGFDNIDVAACTKRGIPVGHTPGVLTDTTADFAFALIMSAARRVVESDKSVRQGQWKCWHPMAFLGPDVHGATLGILGLGRVGLGVAKRASGFDMRVLYHDSVRRSPEEEAQYGLTYVSDMTSVLQEADFISLHTPLTPETHHLIGDREFGLMKSTAILVNTSRGGVVDPAALYRALSKKTIAAAALDVTEPEPLDPNNPLIQLDNIVICPHIASASVATRAKMAMMAAENLLAGLEGKIPPYCVNARALEGK